MPGDPITDPTPPPAPSPPDPAAGDDAGPAPEELEAYEEGPVRHPRDWTRWVVPVIAVAWCCFQVAVARWWILDLVYLRAIHLAFALALTFTAHPPLRKATLGKLRWPRFLHNRETVPWLDLLLALAGAGAAVYLLTDFEGIAGRQGKPLPRDLWAGVILLVLLLEAVRRAVGPALSIVAAVFTLYVFQAERMPEVLASKAVSVSRYLGQMTMGTEGVYGMPLRVSAETVFLFVLFGALLDQAGGGRFFIRLAMSVLGRFRGGPAKAAVIGSLLTGLVSGSSIANIVTTGTFTIPMMKKSGYPPTKAAAIEVAASTDGQLAPPVMGAAAFIIAEFLNMTYQDVVIAAAVPAFASFAALFFITHVEAGKLGLKPLPREELPGFRETLLGGLHFLLPLAVLFYHLFVKRHQPHTAALWACLVMAGLMLIVPVWRAWRRGNRDRRDLFAGLWQGGRDILAAMVGAGRGMIPVALATAAAGIIVGVVALGLGGRITEIVEQVSGGNIYLILLITAVTSLLIGMGLPTTATYIVMASLIAKPIVAVAANHGIIVPELAIHLFCFYFGILADDTPPVGLAAYAAAAIAKSPPIPTGVQGFLYDIRTAILPFMFIFNTDLILHNLHRWDVGLLVFAMACLANFAFVAATQGFFVTHNRWYEVPLFLATTYVLFRPDQIIAWLGHPDNTIAANGPLTYNRFWIYPLGVAMLAALFAWQKWRARRAADTP